MSERWEYDLHLLPLNTEISPTLNALGAAGWEVFQISNGHFGRSCWARRRIKAKPDDEAKRIRDSAEDKS